MQKFSSSIFLEKCITQTRRAAFWKNENGIKIPRRPRWKRQFTPSEAPFARREESFRAIWQFVRQSEIFQRSVLSNKDFVQNGMRDLKLHIKTHRLHRSSDPVRQYIPVAELG
jgi:hypothetical protein